ncbi:MAG: cytochrome c biogenesis protein ResB [Prevotella sp.]|nr:cytochrome c biogenesis protein ResB [Prevotella sp.]
MWTRPWNLKEGFLIGAGLIVAGELLQLSSGGIDWALFAWPVNIILLGVVLAVSAIIFLLRKKVYVFRFLGTYRCAIPALTYAVVLTVIMGLTRQVPEGYSATDPIGLTRMTGFWPFVLIYLWVAIILGQVILRRVTSFQWRDIPFMFNHLGLFVVLVTAPLGSADMRRVELTAMKGLPEWRAVDKSRLIHELPFSVELLDFTIDESPKVRYISHVRLHIRKGNDVEAYIEVNKPYSIEGWKIYQLDYSTVSGNEYDVSTFELVRDPWQPYVYIGIYMMLGGAVLMFLTAQKKRKEEES